MRCPNQDFCVNQPSAVLSGGGVLMVAGCVSVVMSVMWLYETFFSFQMTYIHLLFYPKNASRPGLNGSLEKYPYTIWQYM